MSEYVVLEADYTDPECIKSSLKEMGYEFEEHSIAQNLYGYKGDVRDQKAHIIIRKEHVGMAANDVGFNKKQNGKYELIISQYDKRVGSKSANNFLKKMKQIYMKNTTLKQLKLTGNTVASVKVSSDGKIKIKAYRR